MNYLILLVSINLGSFNALPSDAENTSLFTASTEIAVTVYTTSVAEIEAQVPTYLEVTCWSAGKFNFLEEYINCANCELRKRHRYLGPPSTCIPGGNLGDPTPIIGD